MEPVKLVIDTDIGPDCDDAGALAVAHALQTRGHCRIEAVTHCTSSPYGAGCVDAINRWSGRGDIPVGTLETAGFLTGPAYERYNRYIAAHYPNRYPDGLRVPGALAVLRQVLAAGSDFVLFAIGPLVNLSRLLDTKGDRTSPLDGRQLVRDKVKRLVVMGGGWAGPEWNFQMDPRAAAHVCRDWPTEIWFSTFEVGATILTGGNWSGHAGRSPIVDAYRLHSPKGRMSWDLTAVWAAVMGPGPLFALSDPGRMVVAPDGASTWQNDPAANQRTLLKRQPDDCIRDALDSLLMPACPAPDR